jgi:hypothetical protein
LKRRLELNIDNSDASPGKRNIKRIFIRGSIGFCAALVLLAALTGIILKHGISFNDLTIGKINVSHCTLVWNEKLELEVDTVTIIKEGTPRQATADLSFVKKAIVVSKNFARFFSRLNVNNLNIGEKSIAINLNQENAASYTLDLITEHTAFHSRLVFESDALVIEIIEAANKKYNTKATGLLRLDPKDDKAKGTISALINGSFPVSIEIIADSEQLSFEGKEAGQILEITSLVDLFGLSHNIQRWITDYLAGSRYHLKSFKGQFPWDTPAVILDTLEAEVRVDDTEYTFAPGLEPVKGKYTDVFFTKGVLAIKPHDSTFYGQDGGQSWLDINFNDPANIVLTAYIKPNAVVNDDILNLLKYYKIALPFKQVGGTTDTDLRLTINLNKLKIGAEGRFTIDEGLVLFDGAVVEVIDARILFVNSDVTLDYLKVGFKDLFVAQVTGSIQVKEKMGNLDILVEHVNLDLNGSTLSLNASAPSPQGTYHFDNTGHVLEMGHSSWQLDSFRIEMEPFRAPVSWEDLSLELPPVRIDLPPGIETELSGNFSIKKKEADLTWDFLKYKLYDLELLNPHLLIDVEYDEEWIFRIQETAYLDLHNVPITIYTSEYRLDDEFFKVTTNRVSYGSFFDTPVSGKFNLLQTEGVFYLKDIDVTDPDLARSIETKGEMLIEVSAVDDTYVITSPDLDMKISLDKDNKWSAVFGDISTLYSRSKLLQKYRIKEGSLKISSKNGKKPFNFSADILSPYAVLMDDNGPVEELNIIGKITDQGVTATVNKSLHIDYAERKLGINSHGFAFNLPNLIDVVKGRQQAVDDNQGKQTGLFLSFTAENSNLYLSPNSKILADRIELEYLNDTIKMRLLHGPGKIVMKVEEEQFLVNGSNLDETFMGALIQNSRFQGGQFSIAAMGRSDEFSVLFCSR